MNNHDAVKRMAEAYKLLGLADTYATNIVVIDSIRMARDIIYTVGESKFGKEFIEEVNLVRSDI